MARRITQFFDARLAGLGFTFAQFGLMAHIAASQDDTLGALADRARIDQSTLSRNLKALEGEGLVEIVTAESDLRRRAVWLTEKGATQLEKALPAWRAAQEDLSRYLSLDHLLRLAEESEKLGKD